AISTIDLACNDPAQVTVGGGTLNLTVGARSCSAVTGENYSYASGVVQTYPHFNFTYGFMEARIWLDGTSTAAFDRPGWWTDGSALNWPNSGEISVMEGLNDRLCWHYYFSGGSPSHCPSGVASVGGWHTFGANWQPGRIDFYYDGVKDSSSQTTG